MDFVKIADNEFETLVAITAEEQERGLMHKKWPPPVMCFPYSYAAVRKFWMKNTVSALDVIFCRNNKIVSICYGEPLSTKTFGPDEPVDLVVEVPHGTVREHGIKIGDKVDLKMSKETIAKDIRAAIGALLR